MPVWKFVVVQYVPEQNEIFCSFGESFDTVFVNTVLWDLGLLLSESDFSIFHGEFVLEISYQKIFIR